MDETKKPPAAPSGQEPQTSTQGEIIDVLIRGLEAARSRARARSSEGGAEMAPGKICLLVYGDW
jgi:hypothetical protein